MKEDPLSIKFQNYCNNTIFTIGYFQLKFLVAKISQSTGLKSYHNYFILKTHCQIDNCDPWKSSVFKWKF